MADRPIPEAAAMPSSGAKATAPAPTDSTWQATARADVASLMALARRWAPSFGHERSCRLRAGACLPHRHLLLLARQPLGDDPAPRLDELQRAFGLPEAAREEAASLWTWATHLHLGLDAGEAQTVWKLYLECARPPTDAQRQAGWCRVHRAFKWTHEASGTRLTVTDYDALTAPGPDLRRQWLTETLARCPELARPVLSLLLRAPGHGVEPMLLRVRDVDSPRDSLDMNLYRCHWRLDQARWEIAELARACGVADEVLQPWWEQVQHQMLGHVAAGVDAAGRPFATIYHGAHDCDGRCRR